MSLAADALQPWAVQRLFSLRGRALNCNLADAITFAPGAGFDLDFDVASTSVVIDFREPEYIASRIGGDAHRFAMAAFVSVRTIEECLEERLSFAWGLIRLYYAAFYAGHCVLRLLGQSCSHFDKSHTNRLSELAVARAIAPTFPLSRGLYHCTMNRAQTGIRMSLAHGAVGGTHEIFWSVYERFLLKAAQQILQGQLAPIDAQSVANKLDTFRATLNSAGSNAAWLSAVRNNVQYRHGLGAWEPPTHNRDNRARLARIAKQWTRDPMDVDLGIHQRNSLDQFVMGCTFSIALCRTMVLRISERSSAGASSFVRDLLSFM